MARRALALPGIPAWFASPQWMTQYPQVGLFMIAAGLWLLAQWRGTWLLLLPAAWLLALLALAYAWPRWQLRQLIIRQQCPPHLRVGEEGDIHFDLESRWPLWRLTFRPIMACGNLLPTTQLQVPYVRRRQRWALTVLPEDCGLLLSIVLR